MRKIGVLGWLLTAMVALASSGAWAQESSMDRYIELLRADVRADKVAILTEAMRLTEAQGKLFWPIQRDYEVALSSIGDERVALIKEFAASYGRMTDDLAASLSAKWFRLQDERSKLRKKYFKKVEKALGALLAARFIQVENAVGLVMDLGIVAEIPLLE